MWGVCRVMLVGSSLRTVGAILQADAAAVLVLPANRLTALHVRYEAEHRSELAGGNL